MRDHRHDLEQRAGAASVHARHGDQRRRQDVEEPGQRRLSRRDGRERYGADSARMYSLFAAPPDRDLDWQEDGVSGVNRFLARVYRFVTRNAVTKDSAGQAAERPAGTAQASSDHPQNHADFDSRWHFNTSIASLMELVNELHKLEAGLSGGCCVRFAKRSRSCSRPLLRTPRRSYGPSWARGPGLSASHGRSSMPS